MSTTSTNFKFVIASSSDVVAVDSHLANNFSTLDSILGVAHTGNGGLKGGLTLNTPILQSPTISGTMTGAGIIIATTGQFNTITATGGALTVNSFNIGTYGYPTTAGGNSTILTIVTSNAVWAASAPNTGANQALSNLASVALNTSIGTGTAGFFTIDRIVASSGALTGLTTFSASTGTFSSNVTISGTATINAVNCTGGSITAGGITIGTYALPATIGVAGQVLIATTGNAVFVTPPFWKFLTSTTWVNFSVFPIMTISTANSYMVEFRMFCVASGETPIMQFGTSSLGYSNVGNAAITAGVSLCGPTMSSGEAYGYVYFSKMVNTSTGIMYSGQSFYVSTAGTAASLSIAGFWSSAAGATSVQFGDLVGNNNTGTAYLTILHT